MSLRLRLLLATAALVLVTVLVAWLLAGRVVLRPFAEAVFDAFVDQAVFVADEVERGVPPRVLEERMALDLELVGHPPPPHPGWRVVERRGREVQYRPGPRNVVFVELGRGWLAVRRDLDLERPGQRLAGVLVVGGGLILLVAGWVANEASRPVRTVTAAMGRIAAGAVAHRLEPTGPPELRRIAASFNQMADRVDAMVKADKQLIAGVSHELRTPLARLRLQLELLGDAGADPARLAAMEADVAQLDALIGELLELSRLELGQRHVAREPVDLRELAAEAIAAADLPDHAVELRGEGVARADRALVVRAIANLLSNAGRYAPVGTRVAIEVADDRIAVSDEGPGVPDAELPLLFEPFYRAEASRSRETGGLGLGLMIVRQVALLHGGSVQAENRPTGGLRVVLRLG